jgi:hypothetical protein
LKHSTLKAGTLGATLLLPGILRILTNIRDELLERLSFQERNFLQGMNELVKGHYESVLESKLMAGVSDQAAKAVERILHATPDAKVRRRYISVC